MFLKNVVAHSPPLTPFSRPLLSFHLEEKATWEGEFLGASIGDGGVATEPVRPKEDYIGSEALVIDGGKQGA
jgi:hypothetical protein